MIKTISLIITTTLVVILISLIYRVRYNLKRSLETTVEGVTSPAFPKGQFLKRWEEVLNKMKTESPESWKMALIEADALLDEILEKAGYPGENLGERLKKMTPAQLSNLDDVRRIHRWRNRLVHESGFHLSREQIEEGLKIYQKALEELEAI